MDAQPSNPCPLDYLTRRARNDWSAMESPWMSGAREEKYSLVLSWALARWGWWEHGRDNADVIGGQTGPLCGSTEKRHGQDGELGPGGGVELRKNILYHDGQALKL